jgi:hypothetical protein
VGIHAHRKDSLFGSLDWSTFKNTQKASVGSCSVVLPACGLLVMDALFVPLASAIGASVDQIKVGSNLASYT